MSRIATLATPSRNAFTADQGKGPYRLLRRFLRAWRVSHDAGHLESLPDYLLDDIGLARTEIRTVCRTGRRG